MKILNATTRDTESPIQITPVSELPDLRELAEQSLIHIIHHTADNKYESRKMEVQIFEQKVYEAVNNLFKVRYWHTQMPVDEEGQKPNTHRNTEPYKSIIEYLGSDAPKDVYLLENSFVEHVNYDFELLRRYVDKLNEGISDRIHAINDTLSILDCYFDREMIVTTTKLDNDGKVVKTNDSVNHLKTENDKYCQMEIKEGNKISNDWTVPHGGNLVIYGWLDSSSALNTKAISTSFCVIEAQIKHESRPNDYNWEIIAVQPVIPAKTITYVGFNLLVHEGLVIRARTGFTVGAKSGQY